VPALRHRQNTAVADRSHGPKDALQRLRGAVQVRPVGARVPAGRKPDFRAYEALELAPEGDGAPEAKGGDEATTITATAAATTIPTTANAPPHWYHDVRPDE